MIAFMYKLVQWSVERTIKNGVAEEFSSAGMSGRT